MSRFNGPFTYFEVGKETPIKERRMQVVTSEPAHPSVDYNMIAERFSYNVGTAIKHLWLSCESGTEIEDLEKAMWFVRREIERRKKELG